MLFVSQLAADPLKELRNCTLIPTDWADGNSFLVRDAQSEEFTIGLKSSQQYFSIHAGQSKLGSFLN